MATTKHDVVNSKNGIPSSSIHIAATTDADVKEEQGEGEQQEEVYTLQDPNFYDYIRLQDFTKKTGIELDGFHSFAFKELVDNAADFLEIYYKGLSPTIRVYISNDATTGFKISVINPNDKPQDVFPNLKKTFNYLAAFSSKSNQYRITRGAQGVALKQLAMLAYLQYGKDWSQPIIFQHNGRIDRVYVTIDRKHGKIIPTFEDGGIVASTDTKIIFTLPVAMNPENYRHLIVYCKEYALNNTHIGFELHFSDAGGDEEIIQLPTQHPISKDYKNPNSIYSYSDDDFYDFLNDSLAADNDATFYKAVNGFREIKQKDNRFDYLKSLKLKEHLTKETSDRLFKELRASMQAVSKISDPYDANVKTRKDALIARYLQIKPTDLLIDIERMIYVRTKDLKTKGDKIHKDKSNSTRFPYRFEVLAIPIIKGRNENSIIISGVNYSTSINNKSYFTADRLIYAWQHKRTKNLLRTWNIEGIIRACMAGRDIDDNQTIPSQKLKQECVIICHLIAPKIGYSNGYGKSSLVLEPFCEAIPETIQEAILKIPSKSKYTGLSKEESKTIPPTTDLVYEVLLNRWNAVRLNPSKLDPDSKFYDPWSQSTVFYITRDEELLPLEEKYHISLIKEGTREQITGMIEKLCEKLPGSPKREQLGIFASPRATMYFDGEWRDVDIRMIPDLAGKGAVVLFVEKRGVADQIKHLADRYGIAIVNTVGHFSEYAKDLIPEIIKEDGYVAILTDFDCAGINIAEKVIEEIIELLGEKIADKRVKRLGLFLDDLRYFISLDSTSDDFDSIDYAGAARELQLKVEEPYPKQSEEDKPQQPGTNVVNPVIDYAAHNYYYEGYERYDYIYESFEYLTGINPDKIITDEYCKAIFEFEVKPKKIVKMLIDRVMHNRDPASARRIELDSVIKVVGANKFGEFVIDKLFEFFPNRNYNRAMKLPEDYIGDRFHILPQATREYFSKVFKLADSAAKAKEEEIRADLESVSEKLKIDVEKAVNERLLCEAVIADPEMQRLDKKHSELLLDFNN